MVKLVKREVKAITIESHPDLLKLLIKIKDSVRKATWGAVDISNYDASKILYEKVISANII